MADVSIIIPVYNSEQWLADCLESVIGQTLRDIEVILIDDGSTDRSGAICDEYAAMDQRLKVIHTLNEGVSAARQKGLETATGNYIIHVDADDWIDRNYIEVLYNYAEQWQTDILICDYYKENNDKSLLIRQKPVSLVPKDVQHQLFHGLHGSLCNKLVRRSVYSKANVSFDKRVRCKEDWIVLQELLCYPDIKIGYIDTAGYHYRTNPQSITMASKDRLKNLSNDAVIIEKLLTFPDFNVEFDREILTMKQRVKYDMALTGQFSSAEIRGRYRQTNYLKKVFGCNLSLMHKLVLMCAIMGLGGLVKLISKSYYHC